MDRPLFLRHGNEKGLVDPLRELAKHLVLLPPDHDRFQELPHGLQLLVSDHLAVVVDDPVVVDEPEQGTQAAPVDEFHDRVQLLDPVFEGRPGQHDGEGGLEPLDRLRGPRFPVLDPLGLIQDDEVRGPSPDRLHVPVDQLVVDQLEEGLLSVHLPAPVMESFDHLDRPIGERFDFGAPLVFQGGGGDDEDFPDVEQVRHSARASSPGGAPVPGRKATCRRSP